MTPSEYRYKIELIHHEETGIKDFLLSEELFTLFIEMAKTAKTGNLVLENWKIFIGGGGSVNDFFDWWMENRPDKMDSDIEVENTIEKKKSPFDDVKKKVRMS